MTGGGLKGLNLMGIGPESLNIGSRWVPTRTCLPLSLKARAGGESRANHTPTGSFLDLQNKKQTGDLYKSIFQSNKKNGNKTFCFTSCVGGEGVSTVIANLIEYIRNQASGKNRSGC